MHAQHKQHESQIAEKNGAGHTAVNPAARDEIGEGKKRKKDGHQKSRNPDLIIAKKRRKIVKKYPGKQAKHEPCIAAHQKSFYGEDHRYEDTSGGKITKTSLVFFRSNPQPAPNRQDTILRL